MLLVDFRLRSIRRSGKCLDACCRRYQNVLSVSTFGNLPYFLAATVFDVVTGRRGILTSLRACELTATQTSSGPQ